jgi:2,4-dienoyl-CoA reductase-like NADH-dependent reductase (Old Yellow Enzyme family)/thioredoxin reductase
LRKSLKNIKLFISHVVIQESNLLLFIPWNIIEEEIMKRKYPNLCKPITIGRTTFRNRMFSAPMGGTDITNDGCIGPKSTAFYELRGKGGAGAVTVSECMVHPKTDGSHAYHLDESILNSLASATYTADAIRRHGAIPSLELSHSGMYAGTYMTDKSKQKSMNQWGPSDTVRPDGIEVKALSKEQIADIVASYAHVAGLAKRAGFEMLMIHGGHGWLINQFFSSYFNKRTDEYGGSLENRCRFAIEVLKAVREAVGPFFPIEFRLSGSELFEGGYDLEEGCRIAQQIEPYIDLLHVSAGTYQRGFGDTHPSMFKEHGCNVYLAAEIKKHVSVPVATIGGLNSPEQLEEIIASGKADVVYMARALLADPFLPRKVMENREEEIVKCLRCFTCMAERAATSTRRCTVNPIIGREMEGDEVLPASVKKKVLVAGGGPGGLYAAYTAARRGHEVILCEKEDQLGGILKSEQALPFKHEMYELAGTYALLAKKAGVEIRTSTEVTPEYVEKEAPDALIIAVGSEPLIPPIQGLDGENVVVVNNYYLEKDKVSDEVVVLGGGLAGCECAIHLGLEGKKVHLVEMRDELAPDANVRHRPLLLKKVDRYVTVHTGYRGLEVTKEGVLCEDREQNKVLVPSSTVICALGQRSRTKMVEALRDSALYVAVIGDASKVSTITKAVYEGYHAALDI